jgi:hypothetical protein
LVCRPVLEIWSRVEVLCKHFPINSCAHWLIDTLSLPSHQSMCRPPLKSEYLANDPKI